MNCDLCDDPLGDNARHFTRKEARMAAYAGPPPAGSYEDADLRTSILGWINLTYGHTRAQFEKARAAIDQAGSTDWTVCARCGNGVDAYLRRAKSNKKSGCFIATAVYGSSLAPEIVVFRRFRDDVLLTSKLGSIFVEFYYFASPPLARLISKTRFLQAATRLLVLEPILRLLNIGFRIKGGHQ